MNLFAEIGPRARSNAELITWSHRPIKFVARRPPNTTASQHLADRPH